MTTTSTQSRKKTSFPIWLGITGLLFVIGIAAWIVQLVKGVGVTNQSNFEPWGIYIAGFVFFTGLSAGSLVLAALPVLFDLPKFRPYAKIAAFIALVALIAGGLFILVDIGKPDRLWRIVRFAHLGSPMLWDLLLTIAYLIISTLLLRRLMSSSKTDGILKALAWLALVAGVADMLTGFVFATQVAHAFWYSAVQPISFFVAALASAGAVILLVMVVLKSNGWVALEGRDLQPIAGLTAAALGIDLLLIFSEIITLAFTRSDKSLELVRIMLASPLFWIEVAAALVAIVLLALPSTRRISIWIVVAAVLALVALALKRLLFIKMGFAIPNIQYPGVEVAPSAYIPSLVEWGLVVGLVGLFAMLLIIGIRTLRLSAEQKA
jgi:molybdopterin-containing oxidoreductase family membrane subunit